MLWYTEGRLFLSQRSKTSYISKSSTSPSNYIFHDRVELLNWSQKIHVSDFHWWTVPDNCPLIREWKVLNRYLLCRWCILWMYIFIGKNDNKHSHGAGIERCMYFFLLRTSMESAFVLKYLTLFIAQSCWYDCVTGVLNFSWQ